MLVMIAIDDRRQTNDSTGYCTVNDVARLANVTTVS